MMSGRRPQSFMDSLQPKKLLKELRPGARVVSHSFHMGDWKPDKDEVVDGSHIYLWTIPAK